MSKFDRYYNPEPFFIRKLKIKLAQIKIIRKMYYKFTAKKMKKEFQIELSILNQADEVIMNWPENIVKPKVGLVNELEDLKEYHKDGKLTCSYWLKYERFLGKNDIPYVFLDIHHSGFLEEIQDIDIIVWRVLNDPTTLGEANTKIKIMEQFQNKLCMPSEEELWFYEDKVKQYYLMKIRNLPIVDTFVTYSKDEALEYIEKTEYPIVSKSSTSSSSVDVRLLKNRRAAKRECNKIFNGGLKTQWGYLKQKGYVLFQKFIKNAEYDLRLIIIGENYFGFYKMTPKNDFRASGSLFVVKKAVPKEALFLAKRVKEALPKSRMLAVDVLWNEEDKEYQIIEVAIFVSIFTYAQTRIDNIPGRYIYKDGDFVFEEGRYWVQELSLAEVMKEWIEMYPKVQKQT